MDLLFSTEHEINISLSPPECQKLNIHIQLKRQYNTPSSQAPRRVSFSTEKRRYEEYLSDFQKYIKARGLMYRRNFQKIHFYEGITFSAGEQYSCVEKGGVLHIVFPAHLWSFILDSIERFTEGYWCFYLVIPEIDKSITFASHGDNNNCLSKLIDDTIYPMWTNWYILCVG